MLVTCTLDCCLVSSVDRALDCRAGGHGFNPQAEPYSTHGLKISEKVLPLL